MTEPDPRIDSYLNQFERSLRRLRLPERVEIAADVRSHIAEALALGAPLDSVLQSLGPADALARAYAVELLVEPQPKPPAGVAGRTMLFVRRAVVVASVLAASGFATLVMGVMFAAVGAALAATGIIFAVVGTAEMVGVRIPGTHLDPPITPLGAIALSPLAFAAGCGAMWVFWRYVRFLARALLKTLPGARPAADVCV